MTPDEVIASGLSGASITAFPVIAPADIAPPYVVWQRVACVPVTTHAEQCSLEQSVIQFACYASTYTAAKSLRDQVRALFDGVVADCSYVAGRETRDEYTKLFRADVDLSFWSAP